MSGSGAIIILLDMMNRFLLAAAASLALMPVAEARVVTPRGELAADERATIALFRNARDSVVFISTRQRVADFWTRNVYSGRPFRTSGAFRFVRRPPDCRGPERLHS